MNDHGSASSLRRTVTSDLKGALRRAQEDEGDPDVRQRLGLPPEKKPPLREAPVREVKDD